MALYLKSIQKEINRITIPVYHDAVLLKVEQTRIFSWFQTALRLWIQIVKCPVHTEQSCFALTVALDVHKN